MVLEDRERDFEARYAHDQELKFRIRMRRAKLVGLWAAKRMGQTDEKAYADAMVAHQATTASDSAVVEKVMDDFRQAGIDESEAVVLARMQSDLVEAERQVQEA